MEPKVKKMTFEKFLRDYIPKHPELGLETDELSPSEFAKVAMEHGNKLGFSFSEGEIWSVLGEHLQTRQKIADLGATVKASANGTAMCWNGGMRTDEVVDADWLVITAKKGQ